MENKDLKLVFASAIAAVKTIFTITVVTLVAELSVPFKDWLKSITGHHWITKSWLSVIVFILTFLIVYALIKNPSASRVKHALNLLFASLLAGSFILLGFFIFEFYAR